MIRIISYNILAGGYNLKAKDTRRTHQLVKIISSVQPDIVGLVEAQNPKIKEKPTVLEEIAERLGMQIVCDDELTSCQDFSIALLTRLPVVYTKVHSRPGLLARPLLEVCVKDGSEGRELTVFLTHLSSGFNCGWAGNHLRQREVEEIMNIMAPLRAEGKPHVLMGDFNTLSPGDAFKASFLLRYVFGIEAKNAHGQIAADGHPYFNAIVPARLRFLKPAFQRVANSATLSALFDVAAYFYVPRSAIRPVRKVYLDCFRHQHPYEWGFTCPAGVPAGRIDYIFASPMLAGALTNCYVVTEGEGMPADRASDHLPVVAEFDLTRVEYPTLLGTELPYKPD
jgi:endonuclease/exonuclease/phosphatase family metal-dependent hydrolase